MAILLVLLLADVFAASQDAPAVRFHHLHYRVDDPSRSMAAAAKRLEGTRVLVQGLGVGVRVGRVHLLFDRLDGTERSEGRPAAAVYDAAAAWLRARGLVVGGAPEVVRLASAAAGERLHHVGFVADDLRAAAAALAAAGVRPLRESADRVLFDAGDTTVVEIVAPTDLDETFWCPMHPDVRAAAAGSCPQCGMALVPIPPPRAGEYKLDVATIAASGGRGLTGLRVVIRDPETGDPVQSLATVHERPLHLFIVGRALDYFAHVHPEPDSDGGFFLRHDVPPGEYMLIADFLPYGGTAQTVHRAIVTPGFARPLLESPARLEAGPAERVMDGVRVRLEPRGLAPRRVVSLRFIVADEGTGRPITDLQPYLGAPAHLLIVNADLTDAVHAHPEAPAAGGAIVFEPLMPAPGAYKMWLQFQRSGRVVTVPFVIEVPEG